ncbi:MAG: hypothetical protein ACRDRX_04545 [Pseudonocardiaceae bacterium]
MPAEKQDPIGGLEASRVKFVGMAADSLAKLPEIDDEMSFIVTAVCTGRGRERMKDGELRATARMEVRALVPQGGPVRPDAGPTLFSVPEDDEDGEADPDGD